MDKIVSVKEVYEEALDCKEELEALAENAGHPVWNTYHFTVSRYNQVFDDYHICITGDGKIHLMNYFDEICSHTWKRNTGNIGVALSCCLDCALYGSPSNPELDLGTYPPTPEQIESMARVGAAIALAMDYAGEYGEYLKDHVYTHYEFAMKDGYGPWQGDPDVRYDGMSWRAEDNPGDGGDVLRGKINFYYQKYKDNGIPEEYLGD